MTRRLTEQQVSAWEAAFTITLTDDERRLLLADSELLGVLDRQRQFVLLGYLRPMECPACHLPTPPRQALGRAPDFTGLSSDDTYRCVGCRRRLDRVMPMVGHESWRLARPLAPASAAELAEDERLARMEADELADELGEDELRDAQGDEQREAASRRTSSPHLGRSRR